MVSWYHEKSDTVKPFCVYERKVVELWKININMNKKIKKRKL